MGKINKLSQEISNKIAAGEVVEKAASVVKELVENSIDANASKITIEIKNAGKTYIRITDDGVGISKDDSLIAFERHATSKINTIDDIYAVKTLGFRGEALASIASVSKIKLVTKTNEDDLACELLLNGGNLINDKQVGAPTGTTIIVEDLFFNTPARLKFLKSNSAEIRSINEIVNKLALSNPQIAFKYIVDDKRRFSTTGHNNLFNTIVNIYGKTVGKSLFEVDETIEGVQVKGYISDLNYSRGNRNYQVVFVNGRYIKSPLISDAISMAYNNQLMTKRFPAAFLSIRIDSNEVDVNIHPAKTEVKFNKESLIKQYIYQALRQSINVHNQVPEIELKDSLKKPTSSLKTTEAKEPSNISDDDFYKEFLTEDHIPLDIKKEKPPTNSSDEKNHTIVNDFNPEFDDSIHQKDISNCDEISDVRSKSVENHSLATKEDNNHKSNRKKKAFGNKFYKKDTKIENSIFNLLVKEDSTEGLQEPLIKKLNKDSLYKNLNYIGQIMNTYLIFEKERTMYLIDQHAAHEKVLFENFLDDFNEGRLLSQVLLQPEQIELNYHEKSYVLNNIDLFSQLGFNIDEFGNNTIILREIPALFSISEANEFFMKMIENTKLEYNLKEFKINDIIQKSCKHAIKAHKTLDKLEVDELLLKLQTLEDPYTCPHGRPIIISITNKEIEKMFKRK